MATPSSAENNVTAKPRLVFISYSRRDGAEAAHGIKDLLREAGCEGWIDTEQIRGGADWIKVYADTPHGPTPGAKPAFSLEELRLIVSTARDAGVPVALLPT